MLKTIKTFGEFNAISWEEVITYDTDYWEEFSRSFDDSSCLGLRYKGESSKVPKKPKGMTHCNELFSGYNGTTLDLSLFDTSDVVDMSCMFMDCTNLVSLDLSCFKTSNVTDMSFMFSECSSLKSLNASSFDTSKVIDMIGMFEKCNSLKSLNVSSFDTSKVVNMNGMFSCCENLQSLDLSSFDTASVTNMRNMFFRCEHLQSLDLSSFDTSEVIFMNEMFSNCTRLQSLDISSFDTSKVISMNEMFAFCTGLQFLDLSHFNVSNAGNVVNGLFSMFKGTMLSSDKTGLGTFSKKPKNHRKSIKKFKGNVSLDDISKEIDRLYHDGNISSPKVLINSLRDSGFSDSNIVSCIFNRVESGFLDRDIYMPIVNSYIEKHIHPEIVRNLNSKSVGEVLDILYSRYSESIVNKAMCSYLRPQYLVD